MEIESKKYQKYFVDHLNSSDFFDVAQAESAKHVTITKKVFFRILSNFIIAPWSIFLILNFFTTR